jgi:hypothetical protein
MRNGQWRLQYDDSGVNPAADLTFGTIDTHYDLMQAPDIAFSDYVTGDVSLAMEDGIRFGQDFSQYNTITFNVNVDAAGHADPHGTVLARTSTLRRVWDAEAVRTVPGKVATLDAFYAGRLRRVYGRPRRFAPGALNLAPQGHIPVLMDFTTVDDRFYGTSEFVRITRSGKVTGTALHSRLAGRLKSGGGRVRAASVVIGGDRPTIPIVTFHGACTNPKVVIGNSFTLALNATLGAGGRVTIDPRPWARTVLTGGGQNWAGKLTATSTRLAACQLDNGRHTVTFTTSGGAPNAYVTVTWRDAYSFL